MQLGLQRLRFEIWGESVGLPSDRFNSQPKIPYNTSLDLPQVQPDIQRALENIRQLLGSVTAIDGRYGATSIPAPEADTTTLSGTHIFQKSFDRLKKRVQKGQKDKSILKVTRWAVHDSTQFKEMISRLTSFVDGLYQVTVSLGLLQQRYEDLRVFEEVKAITNEGDIDLLIEATSKHSASSIRRTVSDAASKRLALVSRLAREENLDPESTSRPHSTASTYSFHTAYTKPSQHDLGTVEEEESDKDLGNDLSKAPSLTLDSTMKSMLNTRSCAECEEDALECSVAKQSISCISCMDLQRECSFDLGGPFLLPSDTGTITAMPPSSSSRSIPQHERLLAESVARSRASPIAFRSLSFQSGDAHHGERMTEINDDNLNYWIENGASLVYQAHRSTSVAKRMFHELKTIRKARVPFISATPVADDLRKILASIEGPPETPYEGGIFWILISASKKSPPGPPIIKFHTKVYHPNIDHRTGFLCADYEQKWTPAKVPASLRGHFAERTALWSERTSPDMWSLLALRIAICGLLASPNINDPLIPEIAQKYVEDPESYFEVAKMWTKKYADASKKPDESTLQFSDGPSESVTALPYSKMTTASADSEMQYSPSSVQQYMRSKYDEKFSVEWSLHLTKSQSLSMSTTLTRAFSVSSEAKDSDSGSSGVDFNEHRLPAILGSFLLRDVVQGHLRQRTGECLSKIEQWRMIRELRIALEKELHRTSFSSKGLSQFGSLKDPRIRTLVGDSAERLFRGSQTVAESQYFSMLIKTFGRTKRDGAPVEEGSGSTDPYYSHQAQDKYGGEDFESSPLPIPPRQRRQSKSAPMKPPRAPKATEADARAHRIPPGYSLKNWDPSEEPILLLGSVFDANSLGKWIYGWTVYRHGVGVDSPIPDIASEMWLLLIQLAEKVKRAEAALPRIRKENCEMVEDFIESGERLIDKLKKLLKACETPMLKAGEKKG